MAPFTKVGGVAVSGMPLVGLPEVNKVPVPSSLIVIVPSTPAPVPGLMLMVKLSTPSLSMSLVIATRISVLLLIGK